MKRQRDAANLSELQLEASGSVADFANNLSAVASGFRSVAELCRMLGFNRQQFNRYLTGEARPSRHNLRRISEGLDISARDLLGPHDAFITKHVDRQLEQRGWQLLDRAFPGDLRKLRPLIGYYHGYFSVPGTGDTLVRSLVRLHETDGRILSKSIERRSLSNDASGYISKYSGLASYLGSCIFVLEFEYLTADSIVETVLFPPYRKKLDILSGMTFGLTSRLHRQPFSSPIVWKFLGRSIDYREALARCGRISLTDRSVPPGVRRVLRDPAAMPMTSIGPMT